MKETYLRYIRRVFVCAGTPTGLLNTSNKDTIYLAYPFCTAVASSAWCMWRAMLRKNGAACRHIVCRASRPIDANVACGTAEPLHTLYRRMQLCSCAVVMLQLMCCCCCVWCAVCRVPCAHPPKVAFPYMGHGGKNNYVQNLLLYLSYGDPRLVTHNYFYPVTRIPGNICQGLRYLVYYQVYTAVHSWSHFSAAQLVYSGIPVVIPR